MYNRHLFEIVLFFVARGATLSKSRGKPKYQFLNWFSAKMTVN